MQRLRSLAWLSAAGLGVLGLVWLLVEDDPPRRLAAPSAAAPVATSVPAPVPLEAAAPMLRRATETQVRLRRVAERLRRARAAPPTTVAQLARAAGWIRFLELWLGLPQLADGAARAARLQAALAQASGPVVRQNLIFLAALALPAEVAGPWLRGLVAAGGADGEDALVALAFSGQAAERAAFERLAFAPAPDTVRRLQDHYSDHEALTRRNDETARGVLRSYRAIEAYLREPYFKMVAYLATRFAREETLQAMLGWTDRAPLTRDEERRLLEAWLARYPGHPGSDDMATRIARSCVADEDLMEAARWYSRAAVLPDQDVAYGAAAALAGLCEIDLAPEEVLQLSEEDGLSTPNRRYLQYVWLRRLAAERGFETALRAVADLARREPDSELAAAWIGRLSAPVPQGLDSGLAPLPADDPLRRSPLETLRWPQRGHPMAPRVRGGIFTARWSPPELRLHPWPEPVVLDRKRLPAQLRAWEALAELERRTERARGSARADLLYKQAAVFYHDREVLFPAYGYHTFDFSSMLRAAHPYYGYGPGGAPPQALRVKRERFERTSLSYLRAMEIFIRLEREHPRWAALDKVLFSQGMLWKRLVDYRPSGYHVSWWRGLDGESTRAIRETVGAFERLVREFPDSPLADDARAAAAWWRRARGPVFVR